MDELALERREREQQKSIWDMECEHDYEAKKAGKAAEMERGIFREALARGDNKTLKKFMKYFKN